MIRPTMNQMQNAGDILSTVCGTPPRQPETYPHPTRAYFDYFRTEISAGIVLGQSDVLFLIELLRALPGASRTEVQSELMRYCETGSAIAVAPETHNVGAKVLHLQIHLTRYINPIDEGDTADRLPFTRRPWRSRERAYPHIWRMNCVRVRSRPRKSSRSPCESCWR